MLNIIKALTYQKNNIFLHSVPGNHPAFFNEFNSDKNGLSKDMNNKV